MNYLELIFDVQSDEQSAVLIALLEQGGFEGFEEGEKLKAFIPEAAFDQTVLDAVMQTIPVTYSSRLIAPQNWNAQWESSFEPVQVGNFALIRAGFHQPVPGVQFDIVITPKMSFGTGHHATTFLVMQQMEEIAMQGSSVLDFGTGTGVLAILAKKMGASKVVAVDNDEWSIVNARENIDANGCSDISLIQAGSIAGLGAFNLVLANINRNVLLDAMDAIAEASKPGATVVLSGFMEPDCEMIMEAAEKAGFEGFSRFQRSEWHCLVMHKN